MTSINESSSEILLIDNIKKISELDNYKSKKIITFDYSSHVSLSEEKIPHLISDDFCSTEELNRIEEQIYSLVHWYDIKSIQNLLIENNINLGELFFFEFRDRLILFLKYFIEISNIVKLNPNSHYFVSEFIYEIISPLAKHVTKIKNSEQNTSIYDSIDVPLKLGSKYITIKFSKKTASKIQFLLNKASSFLFSKRIPNSKFSNVLLVNFTTIKNKELFSQIPNFDLNIIKYDRNTPPIWNKQSFDIIKNSNCILENEYTLQDETLLTQIKKSEQVFLSKIDLICSSNEIKEHFLVSQTNFWNSLKPVFIKLCKKQFSQAAKEIELAKTLFKKHSFSKVLLVNESLMVEQIILNLAKQKNIPVYVMQHGLYYNSNEFVPEEIFQRAIPKNSDYFIAWGNIMKTYLINNGIETKKIKVIGSTFFDNLFQKKIVPYKDSGYILLASDPLAFNRLKDLFVDQKELYKNMIEKISNIIYINNKKLIIKTHPQKNQQEQKIVKNINPDTKVFSSGDINPLIQSADLVIVTDVTTVILEAMILQKPVVSIRIKDHYGKPDIFDYCPQISIDSLSSWIKSFYDDPKIKNNLIARGNEYLNNYLSNHGSSSKTLLELLQKN